jgi:bifunctional DNA-binding transcriptional regulator/antitoxin component of YhaV-PrlF toxin-antitoxin module
MDQPAGRGGRGGLRGGGEGAEAVGRQLAGGNVIAHRAVAGRGGEEIPHHGLQLALGLGDPLTTMECCGELAVRVATGSVRALGVREAEVESYNGSQASYNGGMRATSHVMTVSRNGQVSIPAETRARWNARHVVVVDLGDRVVLRPLTERPIDDLRGKYHGRGPRTDRARAQARSDDAARARSR